MIQSNLYLVNLHMGFFGSEQQCFLLHFCKPTTFCDFLQSRILQAFMIIVIKEYNVSFLSSYATRLDNNALSDESWSVVAKYYFNRPSVYSFFLLLIETKGVGIVARKMKCQSHSTVAIEVGT